MRRRLGFPILIGAMWAVAALVACFDPAGVAAEQIVVSNYGVTTNGMPFAIAMEKGYFKEAGADVTGILSSDGGGTTIRNLLGGDLAYGEAAVSAVVTAIQKGADLRIISGNVHTVAEFVWVAMPNSPINTLKDFKGRKIAYTNPRSTSQALVALLLEKAGLKEGDVMPVKAGGFGPGLALLEHGEVDSAPAAEPLWSQRRGKYKAVIWVTDVLPPLSNVVGVTTAKAAAAKPDFIRAVITARRKAVEFMYANPKEAARIIAKVWNIEPDVAESVITNLLNSEKKSRVPYWGPGDLRLDTMDNMLRAQKLVGAFQGEADWSKIVDERFLPDDLKTKKR